uniref:Uncharacterized protein n=1 Tax=Strigamia maritima TaxID=126957 RepID=T1JIL6_STRMM
MHCSESISIGISSVVGIALCSLLQLWKIFIKTSPDSSSI